MKTLRFICIFLLLFNGIGAVYGGWLLVIDPSGEKLKLPIDWLEHAPFRNFLIPGIILLVTNGLLSLFIAALTILNCKNYTMLIVLQGCVLCGWLIIQMIMLQKFYYLQFILGGVGLLLILMGSLLWSRSIKMRKE